MMNTIGLLYEVDARLYELVDPDTGELLNAEAFHQLQMERRDLLDNLIAWYKNTTAEAEAVKREAEALSKRKKALQKTSSSLLERIAWFLQGETFKSPRASVRYHTASAVELDNEREIIRWAEETGHTDCVKYKPVVLKDGVKDLLQSGVPVPGAQIVKRKSLVVK